MCFMEHDFVIFVILFLDGELNIYEYFLLLCNKKFILCLSHAMFVRGCSNSMHLHH